MSGWPKNIDSCLNCMGSSDAYSHGGRGYCSRCYKLLNRINKVRAWDRSKPGSLKGIPKSGAYVETEEGLRPIGLITDNFSNDKFEAFRKCYIQQLRKRLALVCYRERIRSRSVEITPLALEKKFGELLRLLKSKAAYPMYASHFNQVFGEQERREIYALLEEIIEKVPWRGISYSALYECMRRNGVAVI